ncbi:MAG: hypothetical protein HYY24_04055 [Verrucomicrobia bacterium]|nr:hypothetical protein [Verrucomicrobiota bacterium]
MTVRQTKPVGLEALWDYEDKHPVVFASPRALAEARLIAELERAKRNHRRRAHRNGASQSRRRKAIAA